MGIMVVGFTPRPLMYAIFFQYSVLAALALTCARAFGYGRNSSEGDGIAGWAGGVRGVVSIMLFAFLGKIPELFLLSLLISIWGVKSNASDLLAAASSVLPPVGFSTPVATIVFLLTIFAEFYTSTAWDIWPFVQAGTSMLAFFAGRLRSCHRRPPRAGPPWRF